MNVNANRSPRPNRMEEAPGTGAADGGRAMQPRRPAEVLALLRPTPEVPKPILIGGLWKTGLQPQGALS